MMRLLEHLVKAIQMARVAGSRVVTVILEI